MESDIILKYIIKDYRKAIEILSSHPGAICFRLKAAKKWLHCDDTQVPDEYNLKKYFIELNKYLTKYPAATKEIKINDKVISSKYRTSIDETLSRIRSKTASKIAVLIYYIHLQLEELRIKKDIGLI